MSTVQSRRSAFRALHEPGAAFVMPNPWDIGSAKVLAGQGAAALATTSAGHAFTIGKPDQGCVTEEEAFAHVAQIVAATDLPVNADLENGYGDTLDAVAATIRRAAEAGLAGCSIEDANLTSGGAYGFEDTMARAEAAIKAAKESGIVLTLRADGFMNGHYDEAEAVRRAEKMAALGADVIYAPLVSNDAVKALVATGTPVNVIVTARNAAMSRADFAALGAARLSIGSTLARVTHRAIIEIGEAMLSGGDFTGLGAAMSGAKVDRFLKP